MTAGTAMAGGGATTGGRVGNVDVLRAVAALMVLAGHSYFLSGRVVTVVAERWYDVIITAGASGVWLFFAISGYVISKPFVDRLVTGRPLPNLTDYARRRVARILPLYWVVLTAFILLVGAGATKLWQYPFHYLLLHNLVPGREQAILSVAWTLSVEALFYVAVPLLALAVRARHRRVSAEWLATAVVTSWVASVLFAAAAGLALSGEDAIWARTLFPSLWQMFCPGLLVALAPHLSAPGWRRWVVDFPRRRAAPAVAVVLLLVAAVSAPNIPRSHGLGLWALAYDGFRPVWGLAFGLVLARSVQARPIRSRGLLRLGLVSYGIYLFHPLVIDCLIKWHAVPLAHEGLGAYLVHVTLVAALAIPLALASWHFLEAPLIRWSRSRDRASGRSSRDGREPEPEATPVELTKA